VEAAWYEYAEDDFCGIDAERKRTFTMMIREGVATHAFNGELCVNPPGTVIHRDFFARNLKWLVQNA
jgi:capsid protein